MIRWWSWMRRSEAVPARDDRAGGLAGRQQGHRSGEQVKRSADLVLALRAREERAAVDLLEIPVAQLPRGGDELRIVLGARLLLALGLGGFGGRNIVGA